MGPLERLGRATYRLRRRVGSEEAYLRRVLATHARGGMRLLDVGCGQGRFHDIIVAGGLEYVGIDVNEETVRLNRAQGRAVYHPRDLEVRAPFDIVLLSHVIEHFDHEQLVQMLNCYLPALPVGGLVVVFTPLEHRGFYDDFDHVKPYNPGAVRQLFCRASAQTKGFGLAGRFDEVELWLKRDPLWHSHRVSRWTHLAAVPLVMLYLLTAGLAGRLTGYGMLLRKVDA